MARAVAASTEGVNPMQLLGLARDNKPDEIKALIGLGFPVDICNQMGQTAMHVAALWGNVEAMTALLDSGADPNTENARGTTPLHFAAGAKRNSLEVCQLLVSRGGKLDAREMTGRLPYMCATDDQVRVMLGGPDSRLFTFCEEGRSQELKAMLAEGSVASLLVIDNEGRTPINLAVGSHNLETVKVLIAQEPQLGDFPDADGNTAVHIAASTGNIPILNVLLSTEGGKDAVNQPNLSTSEYARGDWIVEGKVIYPHDKTPLHIAAENSDADVIKLLLANGAEVDATDFDGCSALHLALQSQEEDIVELLLEGGADPNLPNKDFASPLHFAATRGSMKLLQMLLARGADTNATNPQGWTPLHLAARSSIAAKTGLLLKSGSLPNAVNSQGNTPLHLAAINNQAANCGLILHHGGDKTLTNKEGKTPLDLARTPAVKQILAGSS